MLYRLLRKSLRPMGYELKRIRPISSASSSESIVFLHISKNAGTQITGLSKQIEALTGKVILDYGHEARLKEIDVSMPYFFSIRDPIARFKSGFYSRKRKGRPRYNNEWEENEACAFSDFEHANDLAESLFEKGLRGQKALMAIESIAHTSRHQIQTFVFSGYFIEKRPPIWIIRQDNFEEDFECFLRKADIGLGLSDLVIGTDAKSSHRNSYDGIPELSSKAKNNLSRWYIRDIEFYRVCEAWMNENTA